MANDIMTPLDLDNIKFLNIFSAEVWFPVLGKIQHASTYYQVCKTSSHFQDILWTQRNKVLFPSVSKILFKQWNLKLSPTKLQLLLKCRKICAEWRKVVDAFLQDIDHHCLYLRHDTHAKSFIHTSARLCCERLETLGDIQNFMEHFHFTHRNPVVNPLMFKKVNLNISYQTVNYILFVERLIEMFTIYGPYVWYLDIQVSVNPDEILQLVIKLKQVLKLAPNLRAIKFWWLGFPDNMEQEIGITDYFFTNPMPTLSFLSILKASGPKSVMSSLVQQNRSTLRELDLTLFGNFDNSVDLTNLSTLLMPARENFGWFGNQVAPRRLKKLATGNMVCRRNTLESVFHFLETNYSESLLELHLALLNSGELTVRNKFVLPNLRVVDLFLKSYTPLDFLLEMASTLETLAIEFSFYHKPNLKEPFKDIQLFSFREQLRNSNIWTRFPKLQTLKCLWPWGNHMTTKLDLCRRPRFLKYKQQ